MYLLSLKVVHHEPLQDGALSFADEAGGPRMLTVLFGGPGVGKTLVLQSIFSTRPGVVTPPAWPRPSGDRRPFVTAEWHLGEDDPARPHPLYLASPGATVFDDLDAERLRRSEQAFFDKQAKERGYVLLALPSNRWFSRAPSTIVPPARTSRLEPRSPLISEDAMKSDLARETKQALSYAEAAMALGRAAPGSRLGPSLEIYGTAMRSAVGALVGLHGYTYAGLNPVSLEPLFSREGGRTLPFDSLPKATRHLAAFAALTARALWLAYPGSDPRVSEGVVCIDDVDLHQDRATLERLLPALRAALPSVQWIVSTASPDLAGCADARDVLALRWESGEVRLSAGDEARVH